MLLNTAQFMSLKKIMVIDDDPTITTLVKYTLKEENYELILVNDSTEVLPLVQKDAPDLIISDLFMPYLNGLELLDEIVNKRKLDIAFFILSNSANEKTIMDAFEAGATDYITKPFSPEELKLRIRKQLNVSN